MHRRPGLLTEVGSRCVARTLEVVFVASLQLIAASKGGCQYLEWVTDRSDMFGLANGRFMWDEDP